ncbi:MAG: S8 family serine peptidase [Actinomycetota bacterium]|nr:S8 family serine peptidase [Actinomycetota bacterium]
MRRIRVGSPWARRSRAVPKSPSAFVVVVLTVIASAGLNGLASGQPDTVPLAVGLPPAAGLPPVPLQGKIGSRLDAARGPVAVFVELAQPPAVEVFHTQRNAGRPAATAAQLAGAAKSQVEQAADRALGMLRDRNADVHELFRTTNAVPGLAVVADADAIRQLAGSPDVRSVYKIVPKAVMNSSTVQLTRTLRAWQQTGRLGDGVRIGIIDDGIDYTHADFGGPGTPAAYTAINPTMAKPSYFPTRKVVGGYDFAGDDYDGGAAGGPLGTIPRPDPNPLSCGQHGNHVAGTAAGFGVNADGSTFRGDYQQLDPAALNALRIGPGTAPHALLYALKVFGCRGATGLTAKAMDWALDPNGDGDFSDRLDVVNLSLGSDYGAPDDPDSLFVRQLALNGVLPVLAAGNGGDLYDIGGAPGNTPEALTVASTRDSAVLRDGAQMIAPNGTGSRIIGGQYSQDFPRYDSLDRTAPVVRLSDPANADGCQPYSAADAAAVVGKHVWLEWDDDNATRRCGSRVRADHALAAKGAGVLLSSGEEHFAASIAGNAGVPVFQLTGPDTAALRPALQAGALMVRLAGELRTSVQTDDPRITDTVSEFSSRDVRGPALKPDVAAPGDTIASALTGSGSDVLVISGTSMASPHVAGIAALVRQARPDWSVTEVKAAVVNTAGADVHSHDGQQGPITGPNRVGAGRVDAAAAVHNQVLAMVPDDPGQVSAGFGVVQATGPVALSKTITLVNKGATAARYAVAYQPITTMPGVGYQLSSRSVDIAPHGVAALTVTLRIDDPSALRRTADPTIEKIQLRAARQFVADASGRIVFSAPDNPGAGVPPDTVALRVPVYAAPRPVSDLSALETLHFRGDDRQAVLSLFGRGVDQGSGDAAFRSLISALQLQTESGRLARCRGVFVAACTLNGTARGGDIRYVGVTSTAPLVVARGRPKDALLAFGITTWGDWYNVGSNTIPFINIDTTGDGLPDFEVRGTKLAGTDVLIAATADLHAPPGSPPVQVLPVNGQFGDVDSGVFDSNIIVLPVSLAALGIDPLAATAPISYTTAVASYYTSPVSVGEVIDSTAPALFDAVRPGLWAQGTGDAALSYLARPGTALMVNRDAIAATAQRAAQLLVLHPANRSGSRVQVVPVSAPGSALMGGPARGPGPAAPLPVPVAPPAPVEPLTARVAGFARLSHDYWAGWLALLRPWRIHRAVLDVAAGNLPAAEGPTAGARALEVVHAARGDPW